MRYTGAAVCSNKGSVYNFPLYCSFEPRGYEEGLQATVVTTKNWPKRKAATVHYVKLLKDHITKLAKLGFLMTRGDVLNLATTYSSTAVFLGINKPNEGGLSTPWFCGLMKLWPELKVVKPQKLNLRWAKARSEEVANSYFEELEKVLDKYNLKDKPHLIYNIDETGFQVEQHESQFNNL
ncbi:hypothetical protein HOLleu_19568 [Holothuria leucospilota]|uniref:Uncharacterized protein n=1 Tax=Holothuria leucospilota TaxID=206669 RepID=A0A9Q1H530_HOLLE|nr:hypothetical protein HOLleu_19568 [Holothuria leucospilota]